MWTGIGIAAASVGGALIGANANKSAAGQASASADRAAQAQAAMYGQTRGDLSPYRDAGTPALQRLMYLTGVGGGMDESNPRFKAIYDPMVQDLEQQHQQRFGMSLYDPRADATSRQQQFEGFRQKAREQYTQQYGNDATNDPAYGSLTKPFDASMVDMYKDPGYQFRVNQGEQAINRAMTSRGLSSSTTGLKSLMRFNQDSASQEYSNAFGRTMGVDTYNRQNQFNMLSYLAGTGQNAAAMTGQVGVNTGAGMAGSILAGGQAQAAGTLGAGASVNNAFQGGLGNYMYMQRFNQLMQRMPVFGAANGPSAGGATGTYGIGE